jgi:hypothetical protein
MLPFVMTTAFDPSSCALFAHMIEQTAFTCLCPLRRPRMIPYARQWLHRNSERAFEALADDITESALDVVNSIEPHLAIALIVIIGLRVLAVAHSDTKPDTDANL